MHARTHTDTDTHTHTHTTNVTIVDQFDDAPAQLQMTGVVYVRVPFTSLT